MGVCKCNEEKWIEHYSSSHKILLVGEGNFSFAVCLAKAFGTAENMIATSFDSKEALPNAYPNEIIANLEELKQRRCTVLHHVDAHTMYQHPQLRSKLFDRIVFNFPHAGFIGWEAEKRQIELHRTLVRGFLSNANYMLTENGEVHINHKTTYPFSKWEIVELAEEIGLGLVEKVPFAIRYYPGYVNMRGSGPKINQTFPLGECSTFKFAHNILFYNNLIDALCNAGKLTIAREMFSSLPTKGLQPNVQTYNIMISGFCKEGLLNEARKLFKKMDKNGCSPNHFTYNIIIRGFLQQNEILWAMKYFQMMVDKGFSANATTKTIWTDLLSAKKAEQAARDWQGKQDKYAEIRRRKDEEREAHEGALVEAKRALSREEQQTSAKAGNLNPSRNYGGGGTFRTKKIFVGGLPPTSSEEGFRQYFESYGHVTDVVVMYDQNTGRPRGFGFITFDTEEAVDKVLHKNFHDLNGKQVEVKRALPKDANPGGGNRSMGGGAGVGGAVGSGYQSYGASGGNPNTYDGRMDSNRYMQPQSTGGGFTPYGSSGYSAPGYVYGPVSNGINYGGYGSYGAANTGYGGPAGAAYGNPNVPNAGYGSVPPGAPRSSWSTQAPPGYGAMGYGNTAAWGAPSGSTGTASGGPGSAPAGQSPSGATGYGNQGYGYGGYGGTDGSYGNPGGYGAVGGRSGSVPNNNAGGPGGAELQGSGGGYLGSGFGDANGNPGYGNAAWRSDQSQSSGNYGAQVNGPHGVQVGYGGGYGSAQARPQQQ